MSAKGHTFKEVSAYLMETVEGLKVVDKDKGQLEDISNFVFPRPAIFMSFGRFEYETIGGNTQTGSGSIRFRIAYENYADSYTGSINREAALAFFEFNEKVHEALQGLSGTYFNSLNRISDEDDVEHKNIIVTSMEYETTITDNSACDKKTFVLADPDLIVTHKKTLPEQGNNGEKVFIIN